MKLVMEEKKLVMLIYFGAMLASLCSIADNVPLAGPMYYVKYLYVVVIAFFCFYDGVIVVSKRLNIGCGLLILHTLLYGLVFVNPIISVYTAVHLDQMMIIYLAVFFTCIYVYKHDCFLLFLEMSYLALAIFLMWCAISHFGDFVNPIYYINIFSRSDRFRAPFGMGDVNYCGNYCLYALILAILLLKEWHAAGKKVDKKVYWAMAGVSFIVLCMLFSTASRSAVISLGLFSGLLWLFDHWYLVKKYKALIISVVIIGILVALIMAVTGVWAQIWVESNREGNMDINFPIFLMHGDYLHGMGYMDNSGFLGMKFGYPTTAMDVYYLYIPFSTGIVGSVLVFGQMLYMLCQLLFRYKVHGRNQNLAMFLMMLFYAVWQVNYMNSRYFTSWMHMVILFYFLMQINKEKDNYIFVLRRNK